MARNTKTKFDNPLTGNPDQMGTTETKRGVSVSIAVINAFQKELSSRDDRIYELEKKVGKFELMFQTAFDEELARRLHPEKGWQKKGSDVCRVSELERLKFGL